MIPAARIGEMFLLGFRNLFGYPLRTLLTMMGIIFGVAAVIAMLAVGEGAQAEILKQIGQLGIKNIILNAVKPPESTSAQSSRSRVSSYGLTFQDLEQIQNTIPGIGLMTESVALSSARPMATGRMFGNTAARAIRKLRNATPITINTSSNAMHTLRTSSMLSRFIPS